METYISSEEAAEVGYLMDRLGIKPEEFKREAPRTILETLRKLAAGKGIVVSSSD